MKYTALAVLSASLAAAPAWTAEKDKASKQESIGLGSGAVIGAAAGGPIGFILGAAFGGWLGDRFHHEKSARLAADARYEDIKAQNVALQNRLSGSETQGRADRVGARLSAPHASQRAAASTRDRGVLPHRG